MHPPTTWRNLLGKFIEDSRERQQIAELLGVSPITLTRWVSRESNPRTPNLRKLLVALPQHREHLITLIEQEFPGFSTLIRDETIPSELTVIPSEFYTRVLHTMTSVPKGVLFWSLCDLILEQALKHLDPDRLGIAIIVVRCMPPSHGDKVRSLRESVGRGNPPWEDRLEQQAILLGAESLAGQAVTSHHLQVNQNLRDERSRAPGYRDRWEESAMASPIIRCGAITGSLLVSSTQPQYFVPARSTLVEHYAELIALACVSEDFYDPERIELGLVPPAEVQRPYLAGFHQQVMKIMIQAAREQRPITGSQAEQLVWQQIEEALFQQ